MHVETIGEAGMQLLLVVSNIQRVPKHERKLKVDSRFKRMFTDKSFKVKCTYVCQPQRYIAVCVCVIVRFSEGSAAPAYSTVQGTHSHTTD